MIAVSLTLLIAGAVVGSIFIAHLAGLPVATNGEHGTQQSDEPENSGRGADATKSRETIVSKSHETGNAANGQVPPNRSQPGLQTVNQSPSENDSQSSNDNINPKGNKSEGDVPAKSGSEGKDTSETNTNDNNKSANPLAATPPGDAGSKDIHNAPNASTSTGTAPKTQLNASALALSVTLPPPSISSAKPFTMVPTPLYQVGDVTNLVLHGHVKGYPAAGYFLSLHARGVKECVITYNPVINPLKNSGVEIARLTETDKGLEFAWHSDAERAWFLRNCALGRRRHDKSGYLIYLREPKHIEPFVFKKLNEFAYYTLTEPEHVSLDWITSIYSDSLAIVVRPSVSDVASVKPRSESDNHKYVTFHDRLVFQYGASLEMLDRTRSKLTFTGVFIGIVLDGPISPDVEKRRINGSLSGLNLFNLERADLLDYTNWLQEQAKKATDKPKSKEEGERQKEELTAKASVYEALLKKWDNEMAKCTVECDVLLKVGDFEIPITKIIQQ